MVNKDQHEVTQKSILEDFGIDDTFRDTLATVDENGKRIWLFPKMPEGFFYNARKYVSYFLLALMIGIPFIKINGHPIFLLNVVQRKFILFGQVFWPQDFYLAAIGFITFIVFIILFTVIFGRVWCGWACPQTIFMEIIFRRIEYWIEGDAAQQKRLYESKWTPDKIKKRIAKHSLFLLVSFLLAHIALAWVVGIEQVAKNFTTPPSQNMAGFIPMVASTLIIYGIYIRFREQMCTTFCPYGRLQGVLLGNDTMVVAYDYERGEPRGKVKDKEAKNLGDCIDCNLCVKVCPTGIDIRNGTQLECVNCTACIDACDSIMDKLDRPKKLIGFHSTDSIKSGKAFKLSARQKAYSVLMALVMGLLFALIFMRSDVESTVLRNPGTLYYTNDDGTISNLYKVQIVNKTFDAIPFTLSTDFEGARIELVGSDGEHALPASEETEVTFFIYIPREKIKDLSTKVNVYVKTPDGKLLDKDRTSFLGPMTAG
ncbi:MAG: cytochrome c oxidase accessory protein CcoG [Bacteroidetes bacterium]|nr:cytochrome c oxidase accessory protein CcoG [Bacteroidota bacterium]